jgi:hypothetical protein
MIISFAIEPGIGQAGELIREFLFFLPRSGFVQQGAAAGAGRGPGAYDGSLPGRRV